MFGRRADKCNRAHHGDRVEAGPRKYGGLHEHERGEDGGLAEVEAAPKGVFLNVAGAVVSLTFKLKVLGGRLSLTYQGS